MSKRKPPSSAEKRVLWEIRQRYGDSPRPAARRIRSQEPARVSPPPPRKTRQPVAPTGKRHPAPKKTPVAWGRRIALLSLLLVVLSGGVFGYKILAASNKISTTDRSVLGQLKDLLFSEGNVLQGESDDRINILLLAIGGVGHKGQNLADTVMVASIKPSERQVALLSIPRDLYVQVPDEEYYSKINAVHAYGESQKEDHGPTALKESVEEVTGLPIHYYGRVDFTAFKEIVDAVGGIDINIENSFFDYWHKISFSKGNELMDGERALAYARARYVEGPEGGDFKRAARQQQILLALKEKIFSVNTALDFSASHSILNSLSDNIRTDLELWEMKRFYEMARQVDGANVQSAVLSTGPNGVLVGTTEVLGGEPASVLKTRTGDYQEIQEIAANLFATSRTVPTPQPTLLNEPTPTPKEIIKPSIEIRNGTTISGLAKSHSDELRGDGYEVVSIGNAADQQREKAIVVVLDEEFREGAQELADQLSASLVNELPVGEPESSAAALIILGQDSSS